jgi:hypothetical protein
MESKEIIDEQRYFLKEGDQYGKSVERRDEIL